MRWRSVVLTCVALGIGGSADAVPVLSIVAPGPSETIPAGGEVNDLLESIYGLGTTTRDGYHGATVFLSEPATVSFTYLGTEALFLNQFFVGANSFANDGTAAIGSTFSLFMPAGALPFSFSITDFSLVTTPVLNCLGGIAPCNQANVGFVPNFFTSFSGSGTDTSGNTLILFLDDAGGANIDDDNHDDMVVQIAVAPEPIPEPGSMLLLGSGLAALWARRRRNA